jgi:hypothetical protein
MPGPADARSRPCDGAERIGFTPLRVTSLVDNQPPGSITTYVIELDPDGLPTTGDRSGSSWEEPPHCWPACHRLPGLETSNTGRARSGDPDGEVQTSVQLIQDIDLRPVRFGGGDPGGPLRSSTALMIGQPGKPTEGHA